MIVIGFDAYNQSLTGGVAKPLTNKATDSDHIPLIIIKEEVKDETHKRRRVADRNGKTGCNK